MEALRLVGWKQPPELREVPEPEPGPGQVVVRIGGAGACHSDLHLMHDFTGENLPWSPPFTLGHENAGWIESVGPGVDGWEQGEPVAVYGPWGCGQCHRCRTGFENYCERHLVPLGDLDPAQAAPLTDAGLTPYHAIKRSLPLLIPGSNAVVIGAGGLGHMALQILAAVCPATVIAVDRRPAALALAKEVGAHHAVESGPDTAAAVQELTRGRGADLVLDLVGSDATLALAAAVARPMGHVTLVGIAGGSMPFGFTALPYEVSLATTYWGSLPELVEVLDLARTGRLAAHVQCLSLADASRAYEAMSAGTLEGRAVIVPGS
jgi:propanol-preferring alcohol dehydrogenase